MKQKIFNESGKGYWMEGVGCLRAEGENRPSRPGHIVIAIEGNGARPSHMGKGFSEDGTMYTLNTIEQHSVCYGISRSCLKGGNGSNGGMPVGNELMPSMTANGTGAVCYAVENHPNDSRCRIDPDGIVQCLSSRMGTGGNNTPFVLIEEAVPSRAKSLESYAVDSHPMDSRIRIVEGPCPSVTAKLAKLTSDDPLVLIKEKQ